MITNSKFFLCYFFLVSSIAGHAQNTSNSIPLHQALLNLEAKFNISFTYADKTIELIRITPPTDSIDLNESINYLRKETSLKFQVLNDRFIAISNSSATRGRICGYLVDSEDESPIIGATIGNEKIITISDSIGFFEIENAHSDIALEVRMLGYESVSLLGENLLLSNNNCTTISLKPSIKELGEIIINNLITTGLHKKLDGSFLIDIENFGLLPGLTEPDVLQSIQSLPGIESINETVSHINIRGGTNDQNLVLWNGIRMFQTGHFFGMISAFNPYLYKNITIIKNGTTAELGNSVSGTIDIKSNNKIPNKLSGGMGLNMIGADLFLKMPLSNKIGFQFSIRRSITDFVKTPVYNNYFERAFIDSEIAQGTRSDKDSVFNSDENFWFYDISGSLMYDISDQDKLRIHFLNINNQLNYIENVNTTSNSESRTSNLRQNSMASGIEYHRLWNNNLSSSAKITLSNYVLDAVNHDITNNQRFSQQNEVLDNSLAIDWLWSAFQNLDITAGYHFRETGISNLEDLNNPTFYRYIKRVLRSHTFYSEVNYKSASDKSNIRFGVRGNYYPKFQSIYLEPRLVASHTIIDMFTFSLATELKNQTATQIIDYQSDFLGVEKRRWVLADNSEIPVMKSKQASVGIDYNRNNLLVSIEGYIKNVDGVYSASQGFQNQFQYEKSIGSFNVTGMELLINKKINHISTWLSYTLSNNIYTYQSFSPPQFPGNLDITHSLNSGINYTHNNLNASLGLNWHSGKPYTLTNGILDNQINYQLPNEARLPNYFRFDMSVKYKFKLSTKINAQVGGAIWNITNHENIYNIYYTSVNGNLKEVQQLALGFTPDLMFRITF